MRKRFPWWLLIVAFVVVPLVEIYVIIQIGQVIGAWWTIALLIADSILGSWLIKREGARAWRALRSALDEGRMPARELADGMLILVGGTLMLTPGFVSDIFGILCILPFTRPIGRRLLSGIISRRLAGVGLARGFGAGFTPGESTGFPGGFDAADAPRTQRRPGPDPDSGVVQGEVVDDPRQPPQDGIRP
jgi:UPF0716 protein FxsA